MWLHIFNYIGLLLMALGFSGLGILFIDSFIDYKIKKSKDMENKKELP